jgi:hypothetical protein
MGSVILFHGPGAEASAYEAAKKFGLVVKFGESGEVLKKDEARELVSILGQTPIGSREWSIVVGPLDEVSAAVGDVLLKTLEEYLPGKVRPFLWARDLGGVLPTIRSRCLQEFVPGEDELVSICRPQAEKLLSAYISKNWTDIISELKESKGDEEYVLISLVDVIYSRLGEDPIRGDLFALWNSVRDLMRTREAPLTPARILSVFLARVG